ncbi:MAG: glycosyltransferase family 39 protein [Candidatus Aminicenantes bacterium]|nr:glycosyltransferase family 39 protein [Candidatus Aminicenantes bacterium]
MSKTKKAAFLTHLQVFLYLTFVFLWFKDNYQIFKSVPVSSIFALIPLLGVTAIRGLVSLKRKTERSRQRARWMNWGLLVLLLFTVGVRIPFLAVPFGLVDSDDMIPVLSAKHISEGKRPAIYCYGENYEGTLGHHIYALVFKVTGFSLMAVMLISLGFFLGFIIVQYLLFHRIFSSFPLAFALCLFYALPIGYLLAVGFHTTYSPLVLLLGSLSLYLSFLVCKEKRDDLLPILGVVLGLGMWTHPLMIYFALTSFLMLAARYRLALRRYVKLGGWVCVGAFPVILNQVGNRLETLNYLFTRLPYLSSPPSVDKFLSLFKKIPYLVSGEAHVFNLLYLGLILLGIGIILVHSLIRRELLPEFIFVLFFGVVLVIYFLSRFAVDDLQVRYLYPIYFCLPVLLGSAFIRLHTKLRPVLISGLFLCILLISNARPALSGLSNAKEAHGQLSTLLDEVAATGETYWTGDYWQVFLLSGLSGEKIKGWSYSSEKYPPYKLEYFNQGTTSNLLFFNVQGAFALKYKQGLKHISGVLQRSFEKGDKIIDLLDSLGVKAKVRRVGEFGLLVYGVSSFVHPGTADIRIPEVIPDLELSQVRESKGFLDLSFTNSSVSELRGFRLAMQIPGFCSRTRRFSSAIPEFTFRLPSPHQNNFTIQFGLDFEGIQLPATWKEVTFDLQALTPLGERPNVLELSGFGPLVEIAGGIRRICEKEVRIMLSPRVRRAGRLLVRLYSPFEFSHSRWHGEYTQEVEAEVDGIPVHREQLAEGENVVIINNIQNAQAEQSGILTLRFKYHLPFDFAPLWKTSALFGGLDFE